MRPVYQTKAAPLEKAVRARESEGRRGRTMWNVQAGLFSVAVINSGYNIIAEVIGKVRHRTFSFFSVS